jgi:hypothetical protein
VCFPSPPFSFFPPSPSPSHPSILIYPSLQPWDRPGARQVEVLLRDLSEKITAKKTIAPTPTREGYDESMIVLGERSSKWHTSATALGAEIAEATSVLPSEPGALQPLRARLTLLRRATILLLARSSGLAVKVEPKTLQRVLTSKWLIDAYLAVSVAKPLESLDDLFDLESDAGTLPLQVCSPFLSFPLIFFVVVLFNLLQSLSHTSLSLSHNSLSSSQLCASHTTQTATTEQSGRGRTECIL